MSHQLEGWTTGTRKNGSWRVTLRNLCNSLKKHHVLLSSLHLQLSWLDSNVWPFINICSRIKHKFSAVIQCDWFNLKKKRFNSSKIICYKKNILWPLEWWEVFWLFTQSTAFYKLPWSPSFLLSLMKKHTQRRMGKTPCCSNVGLSRDPWSEKEDTLLTNYIRVHGEAIGDIYQKELVII